MIGHIHIYINNHQSTFMGPIKIDEKCEKLPPLEHAGPEMKSTFFPN